MTVDLQELLERAVALEAKAQVGTAPDYVQVDDAGEVVADVPDVALLQARVAELEELVGLMGAEEDGEFVAEGELTGDEVADLTAAVAGDGAEPAGRDFDDPALPTAEPVGEEKAAGWAPCPSCGSTAADVYADGSAACEDCGAELSKAGPVEGKLYDFIDDLYEDGESAFAAPEVKAAPVVEETEDITVLLARRAALAVD